MTSPTRGVTERRWRPRRAAALLGLLFVAPSLGQPAPEKPQSGGGVGDKVVRSVEELATRAERAAADAGAWIDRQQSGPRPSGVWFLLDNVDPAAPAEWTQLHAAEPAPERAVLLIHGLDEPGGIFDDLSRAIHDRRRATPYALARFDYPNDQRIASSSDLLASSLRAMRARGVRRVDLVCHSMGGLVARDVLTREGMYAGRARGHTDLPDVERLILVGTPNKGSPWAKLRALAEVREQVARFLDDPDHDAGGLLGFMKDGMGEAGDDLLPGSAFLVDLNARPMTQSPITTVIVGRLAPVRNDDLKWLSESWLLRQLLGAEDAAAVAQGLTELSAELGDGVVPESSAALPGAADTVYFEANHRGLLKTLDLVRQARSAVGADAVAPPAIAVILDRLSRPAP